MINERHLVVSCNDAENLQLAHKIATLMMPLHVLTIDGVSNSFVINCTEKEKFGYEPMLWTYLDAFKTWCNYKNKNNKLSKLDVDEQIIKNMRAC